MPGLDPGIHTACQRVLNFIMDCRVKPGNDSNSYDKPVSRIDSAFSFARASSS
jgi:hypothetical protein